MYKHANDGQEMHTADLVDVFEFVYYLADDRLGGLVASGLGAGVRSLQARPRKPERTGKEKIDSVLMFLIVYRSFTEFRNLNEWKTLCTGRCSISPNKALVPI